MGSEMCIRDRDEDEDEVPEAKLVAGNEPEVAVVLRHGEVGSP